MTFDRSRCAVLVAGFCAFLDLYAPQAVLPQLTAAFHITPAEAGGTVSISTLAVAFAAPFVGMLADRLGRKTTIVGAALLLVIPTVLLVLAGSLQEILIWRFVQGLLLPAIFSATVAYVSEEWPIAEAPDVMGLYIAGSALGGFAGRFVTALLADSFGWRAGFAALTVVTVACALIIRAWLPAARGVARRSEAPSRGALREHLTNPVLLVICAIGSTLLFSMVATFTYVNFHLAAAPYSLGTVQLGMVFLVYPIGAVITPASGPLIRRLGRRTTTVLAFATCGAGLLATLAPALPSVIAGLALFVTGVFIAQSAVMGSVGLVVRRAKSTAVGLYVACYYIGGSLGGVLPGMMLWRRGGWSGCVLLLLLVLAAGGGGAWWAGRPRPLLSPAE